MRKFDIEITDKGIDLSAELEKIEKIMIEKALQRTKGSKKKLPIIKCNI
jgi:transcriptional regulator with PAS, ATPase and Fis domain